MLAAMLFHFVFSYECLVAFCAFEVSAHVRLTMPQQVGSPVEALLAFRADVLLSLRCMIGFSMLSCVVIACECGSTA